MNTNISIQISQGCSLKSVSSQFITPQISHSLFSKGVKALYPPLEYLLLQLSVIYNWTHICFMLAKHLHLSIYLVFDRVD